MSKGDREIKIQKSTLILVGIIVILLLVIVGMIGVMLGEKGSKKSSSDSLRVEEKTTELQKETFEKGSEETTLEKKDSEEISTEESGQQTEEKQTTSNTQAMISESSGNYNIANGLEARVSDGTGFMQNDYFYLIFNYDDFVNGLWEFYASDANTIDFYYTKAKAGGYGGWVFSLIAYDWGDNGYEDYPEYTIAGLSDEKKYIAVFPTDVQYNVKDAEQQEEYTRLLTYAKRIDQNNDDNPLAVGY